MSKFVADQAGDQQDYPASETDMSFAADGLPMSALSGFRGIGCAAVYRLICGGNGLEYVGSSIQVLRRLRQHVSQLRRGGHHCSRLQRCWSKYGEQSFSWDLLVVGGDEQWVRDQEGFYLQDEVRQDRLLNATMSVRPHPREKQSAEANAKRSAALKGRPRPEAVRLAMILGRRGAVLRPEDLARLRARAAGQLKTMSAEDALAARSARLEGASTADLAKRFGSSGVVWRREFYRHNPDLIDFYPPQLRARGGRRK